MSARDIVSVIFSIAVILFIVVFCIVDIFQARRLKDKARRDKEKRNGR
jgi:uncharacterized protein (DUF2062 family)